MTAKQKLEENMIDIEEEILLFEPEVFVKSLIGTTCTSTLRAVYDYDIMCEEYAEHYNCTLEEAADYISYNLIRWGETAGSNAPIIIDPLFELEDEDNADSGRA